jgi:hypothetical protein
MTAFPNIAIVRRDHDFRVVEYSADFPFGTGEKEEARWLALDWWGNCFVEEFHGAFGHVRSRVASDVFLLLLVQPGPVAPDRFVTFLTNTEYRQFGFNPFRALWEGVFDFTEGFYRRRGESKYHIDWKSKLFQRNGENSVTPETIQIYERAGSHLFREHSIIVPTQADSDHILSEFRQFVEFLSTDILQGISICTFTNSSRDRLDHFGTLLTSLYTPAQNRSLDDVLRELVTVDETGSPFTTIRRMEGKG